eukprot:423627-Heterocapsa_arctica.AAC.1
MVDFRGTTLVLRGGGADEEVRGYVREAKHSLIGGWHPVQEGMLKSVLTGSTRSADRLHAGRMKEND